MLLAVLVAASLAAQQSADSVLVVVNGRTTVYHEVDLERLPRDSARISGHGEAPQWYAGVRLTVILRRAGVPLDTTRGVTVSERLVAIAADGYRVVFSLGELAADLGHTPVLLADRRDGEPLDAAHGPFQLIVPTDSHASRSERQVVALVVRTEPPEPAPGLPH